MVDALESRIEESLTQRPKKKKLLPFLLLGSLLVVVAGVAVFLFGPRLLSKESKEGPPQAKKGTHGHVYTMESFLVNLAEPDDTRYLKVKIDMESTASKPDEEYQQRLPQLRDSIITVLSSKRYQDVSGSDGKMKLKEEIISRLNPLVRHFKIKTIYFTEFVVQ